MGMKIGYDLTIEQTQKLVMTPELIQAIQILQFNTQELESYVQEQLLINPVLEPQESKPETRQETKETEESSADDDFDWKEYIKDRQYDDISYRHWEDRISEEKENSYERYVSSDVTLPEHLMFQLQFADIKKSCRKVGKYIIESLDENGYMTSSAEEISEATGTPCEKVQEVLEVIHGFDPIGVGAKDLAECLTIQLKHTGQFTETFEKVIGEHLEDLANNRLGIIAKDAGLSIKEVQHMSDIIRTLEPKPGRLFAAAGTDTKYIVPDVIVERVEDEYVITVNDSSMPHLVVSSYYRGLMNQTETDDNLSKYLSERMNSALWLIKSIEQRKQTIYNVVKAVVKYQKDFLDKGSKYLKTLTLKDIAEEVGIHESTVSRSINGKYLQCPRGVFEIKYFFSAGVPGGGGEGISSNSIKEFIKEMVEKEDPKDPYSDQDMVNILNEKGISISRRTVAKYRDELNILSSSRRRRY